MKNGVGGLSVANIRDLEGFHKLQKDTRIEKVPIFRSQMMQY